MLPNILRGRFLFTRLAQLAAAAASHAPDRAGARHLLLHRYAAAAPAPAMEAPSPPGRIAEWSSWPSTNAGAKLSTRSASTTRWFAASTSSRELGAVCCASTAQTMLTCPYKLGINKFADGKLKVKELCVDGNRDPYPIVLTIREEGWQQFKCSLET